MCCMQDAVIARTDSGSESFWKSDVCGLSVEGKVRGDGGCDVCDFLEPFCRLCSPPHLHYHGPPPISQATWIENVIEMDPTVC